MNNTNNNLICFVIGIFLKVIDDYEDINLFNSKIINFIKLVELILYSYWLNTDFNNNTEMLIVCFICFLVNQIDNNYFRLGTIITFILFIINFDSKLFNLINFYAIILKLMTYFIVVKLESKLFLEEYSNEKIAARSAVTLFLILYLYIHSNNYNLFENSYKLINIDTLSKVLKVYEPKYCKVYFLMGYLITSVFNMSYLTLNT